MGYVCKWRDVVYEASKGGLVDYGGRSKNFGGHTLWTAPRKDMPIDSVSQAVTNTSAASLSLAPIV